MKDDLAHMVITKGTQCYVGSGHYDSAGPASNRGGRMSAFGKADIGDIVKLIEEAEAVDDRGVHTRRNSRPYSPALVSRRVLS